MSHKQMSELVIEGVAKDEIEAHFNLLPDRYFINATAKEVELHLRMVHQLLSQIHQSDSVEALAPIIDWRDDYDLNMTVVNLVTWDRAGLFFKLAGALTFGRIRQHQGRSCAYNNGRLPFGHLTPGFAPLGWRHLRVPSYGLSPKTFFKAL